LGTNQSESILEAYGLVDKDKKIIDRLKPMQCPNCAESNNTFSKFCTKCRMVLSYDSYLETTQEKENQLIEIRKLKERQDKFELVIQHLIDSGRLKVAVHGN